MSTAPTGIPPLIERQLLALDKQIRDSAFIRGAGRLVLGICLFLGGGFLLDGFLGLNGAVRGCLLGAWIAFALWLLWRGVVRPAIAPVSFSALAALVEQQFPELRERLTSLVELRGNEGTELAPGASKLMQDLLARQTVKALDQYSVEEVGSNDGPMKAVLAGAFSVLLLVAPFAWNSDGYALLWSRFFVPWGNFAWGSNLELKVVEGDQVVARGTDVPIHVLLSERRRHREVDPNNIKPLWLNWHDTTNASDRRRLEWDAESESFTTTLPHVLQSVTFDVTTDGARSGTHQIEVADPPVVTQFKLEIEPAAYTGLPAKLLTGVPSEVQVTEFSRIQLQVEFNEPVVDADLKWPVESQEPANLPVKSDQKSDQRIAIEKAIPIELSADRRSGTLNVTANLTGPFAVRVKNSFGLRNNDPSRLLVVKPDLPPEIKLSGLEEPVLVRPDDIFEQPIEVADDYGLTAVELHAESSTGIKHVEKLTTDQLRESQVSHTFALDLAPFALTGGQIVTYRVRAVDNRPQPAPHEVWTPTRTLMINTSLKQLPDQELAAEEKSLEEELTSLRTELNESKEALAKLHQQTEQESLNKKPETDKTEQLIALQEAQDKLIERLQQLSDRLAERRMTKDLAPLADRIAEEDLQVAQDRLDRAKNQAARDQLEPISQAIDRTAAADRQLQQLERHLNELNKLEQDLVELTRIAQRAERLADQLEKFEANEQAAADQGSRQTEQSQVKKNGQTPGSQDQQASVPQKNSDANSQRPNSPKNDNEKISKPNQEPAGDVKPDPVSMESLQKLKDEGQKLTDQMNELLKKHPELLEAARREQQDQLNRLADQARQLAVPQERLAEALKQEAENAPAVASRPENAARPNADETNTAAEKTADAQTGNVQDQPAQAKVEPKKSDTGNDEPSKVDPSQANAQKPANSDMPKPEGESTDGSKSDSKNSIPSKSDASQSDAQKPANVAATKADPSKPDEQNSDGAKPDAKNGNPSKTDTSQSDSQKPSNAGASKTDPSKPDGQNTDATKPDSKNNNPDASQPDSQKPANSDPSKPDSKNGNPSKSDPSQPDSQKPANSGTSKPDSQKPDAGMPDNAKPGESQAAATPQSNKPNPGSSKSDSSPSADKPVNSKESDSRSNPQADANSPAKSPQNDQKDQSGAKPSPQQQGAAAAQKQEQIAREATQQAMELAKETGADSPATKAAADFARKADAAKQQAQAGQLAKAAKEAREAQKASEEASKQLNPDGQSNSPQSKKAQQLSEQQRDSAKQLEELSKSPDAARGAQVQGQRQLADATKKLAEQLDQASQTLKSKPLNSPQSAESGERAKKQAEQAQQAMTQSAQCNSQQDAQKSAQAATDAAEKLKQAANEVKPTPPQSPKATPVPKKVGSQVAQASKQIQEAQQKLGQCNCQNPSSSSSGSKSGSSPSSNPNASSQQSPQSQSPPNGEQPGKPKSGGKGVGPSGESGKKQGESPPIEKPPGKSPSDSKPPGQSGQEGKQPSQSQQDGKQPGKSPSDSKSPGQSGQEGKQPSQSQQDGKTQKDGNQQGQMSKPGQPDGSPSEGDSKSNQVGDQQQPKGSDFAQAAQQFRDVAAMLRQTRGEPKENLAARQQMKSQKPGKPMPGEPQPNSEPGEAGADASGTTATADLSHLDIEIQQQARQNWGRLPGQLRTEILQGAGKKSHPEYTQRIKSYFDEITKPAK